jgi:hypothetical protein
MSLSLSTKQYIIYFFLVILTACATIYFYQYMRKDWILLSQAQKKFKAGNLEEADKLFQLAAQSGVASHYRTLSLAQKFVELNRFTEAALLFQTYLDRHPTDDTVRLEYAKILSWSGNETEAEKQFKIILENKNARKN